MSSHKKKIIIFGAGFVGQTLFNLFKNENDTVLYSSRATDQGITKVTYEETFPRKELKNIQEANYIYICIGSGNMDYIETHPKWGKQEHIDKLNLILSILSHCNARIFYLSTDNVFHGPDASKTTSPFKFKASASPHPLTVYGQLKLEAEQLVEQHPDSVIIRVPLLISSSAQNVRNPLYKIYKDLTDVRTTELHIDNTQVRFPTFVEDIANFTITYQGALPKLVHFSSREPFSRYGLYKLIQENINSNTKIFDDGIYPVPKGGLKLAPRTQIQLETNVNYLFTSVTSCSFKFLSQSGKTI